MSDNRFVNLRDQFVNQENQKRLDWLKELLTPLTTLLQNLSSIRGRYTCISKNDLFGVFNQKLTMDNRKKSRLSEIDQERVIEEFEEIITRNQIFFRTSGNLELTNYQFYFDFRYLLDERKSDFDKSSTEFSKSEDNPLQKAILNLIEIYSRHSGAVMKNFKEDLSKELMEKISPRGNIVRSSNQVFRSNTMINANFVRTGYYIGNFHQGTTEKKMQFTDSFRAGQYPIIGTTYRGIHDPHVSIDFSKMNLVIDHFRISISTSEAFTKFERFGEKILLWGEQTSGLSILDISEKLKFYKEGKNPVFDLIQPIAPRDIPISGNLIYNRNVVFKHHPLFDEFYVSSEWINDKSVGRNQGNNKLFISEAFLINYQGQVSKITEYLRAKNEILNYKDMDFDFEFNPEKREFMLLPFSNNNENNYNRGLRMNHSSAKITLFKYTKSTLDFKPTINSNHNLIYSSNKIGYIDGKNWFTVSKNGLSHYNSKDELVGEHNGIIDFPDRNNPTTSGELIMDSSHDNKLHYISDGARKGLVWIGDETKFIMGVGVGKPVFAKGTKELETIAQEVFEEIRQAGIDIYFEGNEIRMRWDWTDLT